jgi:hypothetical protein
MEDPMIENVFLNGEHIGFVDEAISIPRVGAPSVWPMTIATSVVAAATGWVIEEIAESFRGRRRRR